MNILRYADDTTLMAESTEELKSLLMRVKEEREKKKKNWLKTQHSKNKDHGIRSHHFMANRWGKSGKSDKFYFGRGFKTIADGDCSPEIKRCLLLGRKTLTNLDNVLESGAIPLLQKSVQPKLCFFQ